MPQRSTSYERIADRYERARGGDHRARELAEPIVAWLRAGLTLDAGAGTGIVADQFGRCGFDIVGCDVSLDMIVQAAPRLPGRVMVADATTLPVRAGSVDNVLYVWVLHHVADQFAALAEAHRVLHPGGRAIAISGLSDPSPDDMAPIFEAMTDELAPDRHEHWATLLADAERAGFAREHDGTVVTTLDVSPDELATAIEDRMFSHLWDLPDDEWDRVVTPAVAALRALPEPDRQRSRSFSHPMVVLTRP